MIGLATISMIQLAAETATQLEWIARAQIVMGIATIVATLVLIGIVIAGFKVLSSVQRLLRQAERSVGQLSPHAQPLLEKMTSVATDTRDITEKVRRGVNELMDTVNDMNRSLRDASEATEARVRAFAAVLEVVQEEAEQILLDAAATARGVHATAESLRGERSAAPLPTRVVSTDAEDDEIGGSG